MRLQSASLALAVTICLAAGSALADWDPGDPAKWSQLPDLTTNGMDINTTHGIREEEPGLWFHYEPTVADDFLCTSPVPITDVHIWGSFRNDEPREGEPSWVTIRLGIYEDIPAQGGEPSQPGDELWSMVFDGLTGNPSVRMYADNLQEGWMTAEPYESEYDPNGDTICWQYNFQIDPEDAFVQLGTPDNPIVYWLGVAGGSPWDYPEHQPYFGWKTSEQQWNDNAVCAIGRPAMAPLHDCMPIWHPVTGERVDMAFVITPEPSTLALTVIGLLGLAFYGWRRSRYRY